MTRGDINGWRYERCSSDFSFQKTNQGNCVCHICHGGPATHSFTYTERDFESDSVKGRICKKLQRHRKGFWICPECMDNMIAAINSQGDYLIRRVKSDA